MLNTAGDGKDSVRAFMCADWAVRVVVPMALDRAGCPQRAATLRALAPIVDRETALAGRDATDAAACTTDAAAYATDAAAYATDAAACATDAAAYATDAAATDAAAYAAAAAADWPMVVEFFGRLIDGE